MVSKGKPHKREDKFPILRLYIKNDQEIKLFPVSLLQINALKLLFSLWCFCISCEVEEGVGV